MNIINGHLWQSRLGYVPLDTMKKISMFSNMKLLSCLEHCTICLLAKYSRLPFPNSISKRAHFEDIIHCDVWGPFKVPTYDHKRYFLTLLDDYSRYTNICLMNSKDESIVVLRYFISMLKTKFSCTIKTLRSDKVGSS